MKSPLLFAGVAFAALATPHYVLALNNVRSLDAPAIFVEEIDLSFEAQDEALAKAPCNDLYFQIALDGVDQPVYINNGDYRNPALQITWAGATSVYKYAKRGADDPEEIYFPVPKGFNVPQPEGDSALSFALVAEFDTAEEGFAYMLEHDTRAKAVRAALAERAASQPEEPAADEAVVPETAEAPAPELTEEPTTEGATAEAAAPEVSLDDTEKAG